MAILVGFALNATVGLPRRGCIRLTLPFQFLYFAELVIWLVNDKPIRVVSYHPFQAVHPLPFLGCPVIL